MKLTSEPLRETVTLNDVSIADPSDGTSFGDPPAGTAPPRRRPIDRAALEGLVERLLWVLLAITGVGAANWSGGGEAAFLFVALSVHLFATSSGTSPPRRAGQGDRTAWTAEWTEIVGMRLVRFGGAFAFAASIVHLFGTGVDPALVKFQALYLAAGSSLVLVGTLGARLVERIMAAKGQFRVYTVVLGAGANGKRFIDSLRARNRHDVVLLGVFDDRTSRVPEFVASYPILGGMEDLFGFLRSRPVDQVVVALPWSAEERIIHFIERLRPMGVEVRLCPDLIGMRIPDRGVSSQGGVCLINVQSFERSPATRLAKRALDIVGAACVLVFMAPVIAVVMLVYLCMGIRPTIFAEDYIGRHGRPIRLWSFGAPFSRDAPDERRNTVERSNAHAPSSAGRPVPKSRATPPFAGERGRNARQPADNPRKTTYSQHAITGFLARSGIAGLPKFLSVLKGDLSLVGVSLRRPDEARRAAMVTGSDPHCLSCLRVKPGLTGPAQLMMAGHAPMSRAEQAVRVRELDMAYAETGSLALDFSILWRSIAADWQRAPP